MTASPAAEPLPYAAAPDVLEAERGGEAILLHLGTRQYFQLNATGVAIWEGVRDRLSLAAVVERLRDEFGAPPDEAAAEVTRLLDELAAQGLAVPAAA